MAIATQALDERLVRRFQEVPQAVAIRVTEMRRR
jgi:hypothetical protein